jgi:type IV secretory pathway TrbL component
MPDSGSAIGPGPHEITNHLIETLHHAIRVHPSAAAKAAFGQMLAAALRQQATAHAAHSTAQGQGLAGGAQDAGENPILNAGNIGQVAAGTPPAVNLAAILSGAVPGGPVPMVHPESGLLGAVLAAHQAPVSHIGGY